MKFFQVLLIASSMFCLAVSQDDPFAALSKLSGDMSGTTGAPAEAMPEEPAAKVEATSSPVAMENPPQNEPDSQAPPATDPPTTSKPVAAGPKTSPYVTTMRIETTTSRAAIVQISLILLSTVVASLTILSF